MAEYYIGVSVLLALTLIAGALGLNRFPLLFPSTVAQLIWWIFVTGGFEVCIRVMPNYAMQHSALVVAPTLIADVGPRENQRHVN